MKKQYKYQKPCIKVVSVELQNLLIGSIVQVFFSDSSTGESDEHGVSFGGHTSDNGIWSTD